MAAKQSTRSTLPSQSDPAVDLKITRLSNALVLIADGLEEIVDNGERDLDGMAAVGFASIVRMIGEDLHMLTPDAKREGQ
jgi:hypothetical protein